MLPCSDGNNVDGDAFDESHIPDRHQRIMENTQFVATLNLLTAFGVDYVWSGLESKQSNENIEQSHLSL